MDRMVLSHVRGCGGAILRLLLAFGAELSYALEYCTLWIIGAIGLHLGAGARLTP